MTNKLFELKAAVTVALAAVGELLGWKGVMVIVLALCMALDYVSGTLAAKGKGEWSSTVAREGLRHKTGTMLAVAIAALIDFTFYFLIPTLPVLGKDIRNPGVFLPLVLAWYIITEVGSVMENIAKMGAKVPRWFLKAIAATEKKIDEAGEAATPDETEEETK